MDRVHQPHAGRAIRGRGRELAGAAQGSSGSSASSTTRDGSSTAPARVRRRADGTGAPRNLTPGVPARVDRMEAGLQRPGRHARSVTTRGTSISPTALYSLSLDGDIDALDRARRGVRRAGRVTGRVDRWRSSGQDDSQTYPQNVHVGVLPASGGDHQWLSRGLDRTFETTAGGMAVVVARRHDHAWRLPKIAARRTCIGSPLDAAAPGRSRPERSPSTRSTPRGGTLAYAAGAVDAMSDIFVLDGDAEPRRMTRSPTVIATSSDRTRGRGSPCRAPTAAMRSTHGSCARPTSTRRRSTPCCSTCTAARTPSTARRSSTRRRSSRPPGSS